MKKILMALSLLVMSYLPFSAHAMTETTDGIYAVSFHADWCPGCKILSPKMDEVRSSGELDGKNILFVKFNVTDKTTTHQSMLHAEALGLGELFKENAGKTGFILLLDPKTHEVLGKITPEMDVDKIKATFLENASTHQKE